MKTKDTLLKNLNLQQIEAVRHFEGPALVVAGPGSGKTRVLTHRVAYLIHKENVSENNILCVTFTNKAATEIKHRITELLSDEKAKFPWAGTFHSICSKILRKDGYNNKIPPSFVIYDADDQLSLIKHIQKDFGIDPKQTNPNAVLSTISSAKSELIGAGEYQNLAQGFFPAIVTREILIRLSSLKPGKWLFFLVTCVALAITALYELIEWWVALLSGEDAEAFLGTQGYVWDTQSDMAWALSGALIGWFSLKALHDKQLRQLRAAADKSQSQHS